jgi:hypothetical protein
MVENEKNVNDKLFGKKAVFKKNTNGVPPPAFTAAASDIYKSKQK